jgi:hypothetical protein
MFPPPLHVVSLYFPPRSLPSLFSFVFEGLTDFLVVQPVEYDPKRVPTTSYFLNMCINKIIHLVVGLPSDGRFLEQNFSMRFLISFVRESSPPLFQRPNNIKYTVDGRIISKWIIGKQDERAWFVFMRFRAGTADRFL